MEGRLLTPLAPKPVPQPVPPCFRLDLHCSYHQGPGHDTDHCNDLRHAIQDLIDQGLVNLGLPSVTTNPLPTHSTHAVPPPLGDIHHINLIEDDSIHMLSLDDGLPKSIVLHDSFDSFYAFGYRMSGYLCPFTLWLEDDDDSNGRDIQIVTHSGRIAQPPPAAVRPFEGTASYKEVMREDDERCFDSSLESNQGKDYHHSRGVDSYDDDQYGPLALWFRMTICTFGVIFGKLLGHMVSEWGIEVVPNKIKAILDMPVPRIEKKIRGFLAQIDDSRKERAIYYLKCSVHLISRLDLLRYLFDRPALTGRLMRWLILLIEFDIQYVSQKSIKGSIVVDHLTSLLKSDDRPVDDDFPDEEFVAMTSLSGWCMYFDGATNHLETALEFDIKQMEFLVTPTWYLDRFRDIENWFADALATLASSVDILIDVVVHPLLIELTPTYYCLIREVEVQDDLPWRSTDGMFLFCLDRASADRVMERFT
ncbi:hypothetical protein CK203_091954 [Vitis vinifera]|uniref:Reverse transcriptase RNase H-like domain-containing protein n=1 Tax=Vitis vinifera TaxID=29760 RepID=A0A438BRI5_VITVI|nr:hypothetical protein CK203_091954 [Vitis vinifera]